MTRGFLFFRGVLLSLRKQVRMADILRTKRGRYRAKRYGTDDRFGFLRLFSLFFYSEKHIRRSKQVY